jgi:CRP-like cAMP-binding protein
MLLNLSYYLNVRSFPVGHVIYKEGDVCDEIAIVKQGSFELVKHVPSNI